ncbi:hypothetical protein MNEG_9089 [Monoraphidium neglectum]|uniref:1,4-alpha-D-glucan glucanohydrolase n=1 Tax=Monoraphidium neglectum TaxID=145388 RepID=A0A0D2JHM8_9CHLO|nr:hypothetical protein MNEG_9089 [Monoraphidium neglectum]KIY98872.1 hypothetical protein MNEG_9089 [Monoraphidium neglectum]|eukprot:XP_013897892.1 hypothetical protein MNEG_9089 [Monoraphidium neglectum]
MGMLGLHHSCSPPTAHLSRPRSSLIAPPVHAGACAGVGTGAASAFAGTSACRSSALSRNHSRRSLPCGLDKTTIDNKGDPGCTTIKVVGPGQSDCLMLLVNGLFSEGYKVLSSSYSNNEGMVEFTVRVTGESGGQLSDVQAFEVRELIDRLVSTTSMSVRPAIYGMVAERELQRLASADSSNAAMSDALDLERTATEVAVAAARFAAAERRMASAASKEDDSKMAAAEKARSEAASILERSIAAIEAMITGRRIISTKANAPPEEPKTAAERLKEQMLGKTEPPSQQVGTGPGAGNGYELLLQGFNWESHKRSYYKEVVARAKEWAEMGFTSVWLPPPSDSVSPQGYLPRDLYQLDSAYGSEGELREAINALHEAGLKAIADIVINHRWRGGAWAPNSSSCG